MRRKRCPPSLRAKRSNPGAASAKNAPKRQRFPLRLRLLDCFASLAMTQRRHHRLACDTTESLSSPSARADLLHHPLPGTAFGVARGLVDGDFEILDLALDLLARQHVEAGRENRRLEHRGA